MVVSPMTCESTEKSMVEWHAKYRLKSLKIEVHIRIVATTSVDFIGVNDKVLYVTNHSFRFFKDLRGPRLNLLFFSDGSEVELSTSLCWRRKACSRPSSYANFVLQARRSWTILTSFSSILSLVGRNLATRRKGTSWFFGTSLFDVFIGCLSEQSQTKIATLHKYSQRNSK